MSYKLTNIEVLRQYISLSVAISGVVADNNTQLLVPSVYFINLYAIIDILFVNTWDIWIHHLLVVSCGSRLFTELARNELT